MSKTKDDTYTDITNDDINSVNELLKQHIDRANKESDSKSIYLYELVAQIVNSYLHLVKLIQSKRTKLRNLRRMLFGPWNEKSKTKDNSLDKTINSGSGDSVAGDDSSDNNNVEEGKNIISPNNSQLNGPNNNSSDDNPEKGKKKRKGGGGKTANGSYTGGTEVHCPLCEHLRPGNVCTECNKLKLYALPEVTKIRLIGSAPVTAIKFILERSGCACGAQFSGEAPDIYKNILEDEKFSPSALSSIIHQKFDLGVPYGALASYQESVGIPLPASTQANKLIEVQYVFDTIFNALQKEAANMDIVGFDDTSIKILEGRKTKKGKKSIKGHGSVFVCSNLDSEITIALYYLNFDHAGIELLKFIQYRSEDRSPMITICDGLKSYESPISQSEVKSCNCNTHARRKFFQYDENDLFCSIIIDRYKIIYKNEKDCKELKHTPLERMEYHYQNSSKALSDIYDTCKFITTPPNSEKLPELRSKLNIPEYIIPSEPNSDLHTYGEYVLKRWNELTNFTRVPGVPLDTNYVEREVKSIIGIRKKGLFFKTINSATNSGKILSLIETAKLCNANSSDYIEFILTHPEDAVRNPKHFLPWNYQVNKLYRIKQPVTIDPGTMPSHNHHSSVVPVAHGPPS